MALQCLYIKSNPKHICGDACRVGKLCALNGLDYHVCSSAYEGLVWLRKHKAEVVVVTLPCPDVVWSSLRSTISILSPSSYIVTVCDRPTESDVPDEYSWESCQGFNYAAEEHIVKVISDAGADCQLAERIGELLAREFHAVVQLVPRCDADTPTVLRPCLDAPTGSDGAAGARQDAGEQAGAVGAGQDAGEHAGAVDAGQDAGEQAGAVGAGQDAGEQTGGVGAGQDAGEQAGAVSEPQEIASRGYNEPLLLAAFSQKNELVAATSFSNRDVAALQSCCRQQSELLRYWESQWNALLQMLGVGVQIGSTSRAMADSLQLITGFAEMLSSDASLPAQSREMLAEIKARAVEASKKLNNIEEALHVGNSVPLTYVSPRLLILDVLQQLNELHVGTHEQTAWSREQPVGSGQDRFEFERYTVTFQPGVGDYTLLTDRRQFSTFILNLFLWAESNREAWRQFRARMLSLAGKYESTADDEDGLILDVSVTADSRLHMRIFDSCGMVWPLELLGTPENPGPLYTSIAFVWPGTQVTMWGLALVRAFTALHQGMVEVTNADEGVYLDVELAGRLSQEQIKESLWSREEASRSLGSVLFVEDDEKGVRESVFTLRKAGFDVLVCDRADRAMEAVRHNDFDVMILDLNLPDMNGMDLYREMVGICPALDQRAVFVTGFLGTGFFIDSELRRFFAENHCLYLAKPYSATELLRSVKATLSKRVTPARQNLSERVL